jgi:uncharacterized protein (DUF1697 family)
MSVQIALLRGVNLGPRNRVSMAALAHALGAQGLAPVRTYLQSGNVVLASELSESRLAEVVKGVVREHFDIELDVLVRSRDELAAIVANNPLSAIATDPKRYQVSFLAREVDRATLQRLRAVAGESERLESVGRELYAWHPTGVARSKLWAGLAARTLGVPATARNWSTVESLLALADEHARGG